MDFIQSSNKQVDKFGVGKHGFSAGNPTGGVLATYFSNTWADGVQQEIINTIEAAGLAATGADLTQLLQAIKKVTPGRLQRILRFRLVAGVQNVSTNGGADSTTGASTYTPSANAKFAIAHVQGGGNGGAGGAAPTLGNVSLGSPGGVGAFGSGYFLIAAIGASQVITVGAGGGSTVGGNGVAGGASSFGSLLSAPGGLGALALNNFPASNNANGNGSITALPTGANLESVAGFCSFQSLIINAGVSSGILAASGMSSRYGNGGQGAFNATGGAAPVTSYGAGGGTVALTNPTAAQAGGAGAAGVVFIFEYE